MKKNEFLEKLLAALEPLSEDERKQILDYCEELFCDGLEQGLSEEECVARFGSPEEAAAQFREEYSAQPSGSAPQRSIAPVNVPDGDFHTLDLSADCVRLEVEPRQEADFRIVFDPDPERDVIESEQRGGVWYFRHRLKKKGMRFFLGFGRPKDRVMTIQVPASFAGTLLLQTRNAKIRLHDIQILPKISLVTSNAQIEAERCGAARLFVKTTNAAVRLSDAGTQDGDLEAVSSNGQIQAANLLFAVANFHTSNSAISVSGAQGRSLQAESSNANIHAAGCRIAERISLASSNGSVSAEKVETANLSMASSNGRLTLEGICAGQIDLSTSNASITGTVLGDMREYATRAGTSNGSCNIPNMCYPDQTKSLSAFTSNGKIQIDFQP